MGTKMRQFGCCIICVVVVSVLSLALGMEADLYLNKDKFGKPLIFFNFYCSHVSTCV